MPSVQKTIKRGGALLLSASLVLAIAPTTLGQDEGEPIVIGHLNYYDGEFVDVGPWFADATELIVGVINEDPPLGRSFEVLDEDIAAPGEGAVARKFIDQDGVDILLNPAHNYLSYRDYLIGLETPPLMPSVHGGSIVPSIGGSAEEPIFRGAPQDSGQTIAAVLYAKELGAETIAIAATEIEGSQLQKTAGQIAAEELGIEVVSVVDLPSLADSYRAALNVIADAEPDAIIIASQASDGGTFVKNAFEAGLMDTTILGTTEWLGAEFPTFATPEALSQMNVLISAFVAPEGPAWDDYAPRYNAFAEGRPGLEGFTAENSYNMQYYDVLTATALAIQQAGSTDPVAWSEAMHSVSNPPGKVVNTYAEGMEAIRAGEEIDYQGVTGPFDYNETGVVTGLYGIQAWDVSDPDNATLTQVAPVASNDVLAIEESVGKVLEEEADL